MISLRGFFLLSLFPHQIIPSGFGGALKKEKKLRSGGQLQLSAISICFQSGLLQELSANLSANSHFAANRRENSLHNAVVGRNRVFDSRAHF